VSVQKVFHGRKLRVCYWNTDPRVVSTGRMVLESELAQLGDLDFREVRALDDPSIFPCDVLVIAGQKVPDDEFIGWLQRIQTRMIAQGGIWVPAVIVADVAPSVLHEAMTAAIRSNWYFDIVSPDHVRSLPIRVANFLRLHDHLHELRRYGEAMDALQSKVNMLEAQVQAIHAGRSSQP